MDLKEFLRPNKSKVLNTILLLGVLILISFLCIILISPYILYPVWILSLNITAPFFFLTILLIAYIFGCYIDKNKKWSNGIFLFIVTFIAASILLMIFFSLIIPWWNATFGQSCNLDSDCHDVYCHGGVNNMWIHPLEDPFMFKDCQVYNHAVCENKTCKAEYSSENLYGGNSVIITYIKIVALENTTDNAIKVTYSNSGKTSINTTAYVQFFYNGIANQTATGGVLPVGAIYSETLEGTSFSPGNSVQLLLKGQRVSSCTVTSEGADAGHLVC